jgi:hypothetical protein
MAGIIGPGTGEVYELRRGEILSWPNPLTFLADAGPAVLAAWGYMGLLNVVTSVRWGLGNAFAPGFQTWADFPTWNYGTPGFTLVTFNDYAIAPGAILWDTLPSATAQFLEAVASVSLTAALVYVNYLSAVVTLGSAGAKGAQIVELSNQTRGRPNFAPPPEAFIAASIGAITVGIGGFGGGF